jgi:hypothetical protein
MNNTQEKEEFDTTVQYITNLLSSGRSHFSVHKMGATVIGIRTNISGTLKLHTYVLLFPFMKNESIVPYTTPHPNIFVQDICFHVDEPFYSWLYEEMKRQNSMIILSLESDVLKVLPRGDALITMDCANEKGMEFGLEFEQFEQWYQAQPFPKICNITIAHPYLYMVPFPVKPILIQTKRNYNGNFITFS